ncbi:MAG: hypothetical protein ACJZ49_05230 [Candidatus Thalassarchaeaceae archaeon]|nr:MAG: hypothetical protein CBC45_004275 [Euryarchaeota archaeon TMED85]
MESIQRFRLASIFLLIPSMALPVFLNGPRYLYLYATQWSIELAIISLLIGYLHERYPTWNLEKVASASLGAAIYLALGTMVAFWVAFARVYFPLISIYWIVALTWSHIIPQAILFIYLRYSDIQIRVWHGFLGALIAIVYLFIDWYRVVIDGSPTTYEFLIWEGNDSMIKSSIFVFGSILLYLLVRRINLRFPVR